MTTRKGPSIGFRSGSRKAVRRSDQELVRWGELPGMGSFPALAEPGVDGVDLAAWLAGHREAVEARLLDHGALLLRGFDVPTVEAFRSVARSLGPELLDYRERAAPRHEVGQQVFTSTEFPADQWIPLHHEMSYSHNWPTKLFFFCVQPPAAGGRTPLVDDRALYGRIPDEIRTEFEAKKVMYVRNYGEGVDLPWQVAFQTDDRATVEAYCRRAGAELEWRDRDRLQTRSVRQVTATHPRTGDTVWFNHAHMFHSSNLAPRVRELLLEQFAPDELPRNAFYGDGSPIPDEVAGAIRDLYREASVGFDWQRGDVLVVDNFLASHGREPFEGERKIVVAMAELHVDPEVAARGGDAPAGPGPDVL